MTQNWYCENSDARGAITTIVAPSAIDALRKYVDIELCHPERHNPDCRDPAQAVVFCHPEGSASGLPFLFLDLIDFTRTNADIRSTSCARFFNTHSPTFGTRGKFERRQIIVRGNMIFVKDDNDRFTPDHKLSREMINKIIEEARSAR